MAKKQDNVLAVIVWVIGLLGCFGYINPFAFYALLIPIIFWLLGNKLSKSHAKEYFNVLLTAVILYLVGYGINYLIGLFGNKPFDFTIIAYAYFILMSILGLFKALDSKKYKPLLSVDLFK